MQILTIKMNNIINYLHMIARDEQVAFLAQPQHLYDRFWKGNI